MNRFNFFSRPTAEASGANGGPDADPYDDRAPLSPGLSHPDNHQTTPASYSSDSDDLEAGQAAPPNVASPEMAERRTSNTRFLHRFRPTIPSFFSGISSSNRRQEQQQEEEDHHHHHQEPLYGFTIRPSSSHYSGLGVRGAPDTVINDDGGGPKSPVFRLGDRDLRLPGTRLHLPNLERTWTQGSNGPPTRPGTAAVAVPEPAHLRSGPSPSEDDSSPSSRDGEHGTTRDREHRRRHRRREGERSRSGRSRRSERSGRSRRSGRSGHSGRSSGRRHRSTRDDDERRRRERRERRERRRREEGSSSSSPSSSSSSSSSPSSSRSSRRPPPKHFLFCFPWVKSRRIRSQILRCFVSGMFLALTLTIFLSLFLTKHVTSDEFTIMLILILLFVAIFFCHSLVRLAMLVVRARKRKQMAERGQISAEIVPGGYAVPREPIPVVLVRDEEAAGIESEATKMEPPAYGVWRESVRVDPDRFFWARNEHAPPLDEVSELSGPDGSPGTGGNSQIPRPPSYSSDDGVSYVVDARPRSIAPPSPGNTAPGGLPHPSQTGMVGSWV